MNCSIEKTTIEYGLSIVSGAVDRKKIGESITGCIFARAYKTSGHVELHATDLEIFSSITLAATEIIADGAILLPADKLTGAIKGCGPGPLEICATGDKTTINSHNLNYEISGLVPDDFPLGPSAEIDSIFDLAAGQIQNCISAVHHAIGTDATRPHISGINFALTDNGRLTVAATNGHCLSLGTLELSGEQIHQRFTAQSFTLLPKAASVLSKISAGISIGRVIGQSRLSFASGSISICVAEPAGNYPEYRRIIPQGDGHIITVAARDLISALESTCIMSDDQYRSVNLRISGETINITALGANDIARATVPCLCDCDITIRINSRYLLAALKSLGGDEIYLKHISDKHPLLLLPADHGQWDERIELIMMLGA